MRTPFPVLRQVRAQRATSPSVSDDNTPTTHIASPQDDSVALCGTRRPEHIGVYEGQIGGASVPCVVCLDVQDEARSARARGEA